MFTKTKFVVTKVRHSSTTTVKRNAVQTIDLTNKRDAYYKKLAAQSESNVKPEGWDAAKPFEAMPGPKPLPVVGNMWRFLPVIGEFYKVPLVDLHESLWKKYGDILVLGGLPGMEPMVCLYNPNDIQTMLRNEGAWPIRRGLPSFAYYRTHIRKEIFQGTGGLLSVNGEDWFKFRSTVNPILMQPRAAQLYVTSMDEVANELVENMRYFARKDANQEMPDDFLNELFKWTLESMGVIAFDKRLDCLDLKASKNSEGQKLITSVNRMFELMFDLDVKPSLWKYVSTPKWREYVEILDFLTMTILKHIEEGLNRATEYDGQSESLRSVLLRLAKVDKKVALAMTIDMMMAGIDTTGRTMAAALYYLSQNPDKQEKLREEILKHLPNKDSVVTKEMLNSSAYLKAVIKETTRLAPIAIGNQRKTVKPMVLSGYQIPKDMDIISMNLYISKDEKYFKKADKFIPERWLRSNTDDELSYKHVNPFVFLPFGFGPRSCIGKRLANLELEVGLSKILRNFRLSWERDAMVFESTLLYGVADPLKIKLEEIR